MVDSLTEIYSDFFTVLTGYAAVRIAKQELQAATDSVRYADLLPAYVLLFHAILVDGLMWWLLRARGGVGRHGRLLPRL